LSRFVLIFSFLTFGFLASAQNFHTLRGYVTNIGAEPLVGVYVRVTNLGVGTVTNEKGQYELNLPEGLNRVSYTFIGYEQQRVDLVIKNGITQNRRLLVSESQLKTVEINNKRKDLSYEIVKKTIENRELYANQYKTQKRHIYIKSVEDNTYTGSKEDKDKALEKDPSLMFSNDSMPDYNLFEGDFEQHKQNPNGFKEEKNAAKKLGNQRTLFYTSTTDADFDFNKNLISIKKLGDNAYISPLSSTAFLAYKYKLVGSRFVDGQKIYTIRVSPRKMGNALFKGEIEVWDSLFALKSVDLEVNKNSLIRYDKFNIKQEYYFENGKRVLSSEYFTWHIKTNKLKTHGHCSVTYTDYQFDNTYPKRYFNAEVAVTKEDAYEKDTSFWAQIRPIPLTTDENRFINYQDSLQRVRTSKVYLDSIDSVYNKLTLGKALWNGFGHINREKKSTWNFDPSIGLIDPVAIGGWRLRYSVSYFKKYESRKWISIAPFINYGLRNNDVKGNLNVRYRYDPKKLSTVSLNVGKYFGFVNQFATLTDIFNRSNFFEQNHLYLYHNTELFNGFYLNTGVQNILRQDLGDFQFNPDFDSVFVNNRPSKFDTHSAFEAIISISYTPKQLYIQEPKEKIILGSKFPIFSLTYKHATPKVFGSSTKFKSMDLGIRQKFNVGIFGTSEYSVSLGGFIDTSKLRIMDYRYQRGGDPFLLLPPMYGFQMIDSTFSAFSGVVEGHYVHQFNGFITSKIPGIKQLGIKATAGAGILFVPERNYQYSELLTGVNRIFKIGKERLRLGVYYVVAQSNVQGFTSGFKFSLEPYNADNSTWSF